MGGRAAGLVVEVINAEKNWILCPVKLPQRTSIMSAECVLKGSFLSCGAEGLCPAAADDTWGTYCLATEDS